MANKLYEETHVQNVANAIRAKTGKTDLMTISQMSSEIESILVHYDRNAEYLVYKLPQETVFNGTSTYVDTGIQLLKENGEFTIYIDVTNGTGNKSLSTIFHCMNESSPYPGLSLQGSNYSSYNDTYVATYYGAPYSIPRSYNNSSFRLALRKESDGTFSAIACDDGILTVTKVNTSTSTWSSVTQNLLLGCYQTTSGSKNRFWNGTIHDFRIYNKALSNDELNILNGGIDTSDATATASDMANGVTAYVNGEKITGNIPFEDRTFGTSPVLYDTNKLALPYASSYEKRIIGGGKILRPYTALSNLGDAAITDVSVGKTFTSTAGIKATGIGAHGKYVWERYAIHHDYEITRELVGTSYPSDYDYHTGMKTDYYITQDGYFKLSETSSLLNGYYGILNGDGKSIYEKEWVYVYNGESYDNFYKLTITGSTYANAEKSFSLGYVSSNTSDAYPDDGEQDGYYYVKVDIGGSSSGSSTPSLVIKTGTTTSATIATGLSSIKEFFIYKESQTSTGLIHLHYSSTDGTSYLYASTWSTSTYGAKSITNGTTNATVGGGSITLPSSTASSGGLSSGVTYTWVAIGEE